MCGIAGFVGGFHLGLIGRMNDLQKHRGPDGRGVFEDQEESVALGHVRLAVLDLSDSSSQPMKSKCGRYVLTYNGEIYNFEELRDDLKSRGAIFCSTGDTEVLLQGIALEGLDFIERLNGMFAFALWDREKKELLLVRDRMGIKPLYYSHLQDGSLVFASEIKSLLAHSSVQRAPNLEVLVQHLGFCHACGDQTAINGVNRLGPGSVLAWRRSDRELNIRPFWSANYTEDSLDSNNVAGLLRETVSASVARQMVSDVPVGAFLSGGLDSSLIVQEAARGRDFSSYTITYQQSENRIDQMHEDAPYARQMAESVGSKLTEIEVNADVANLLPKLIWHLDEPISDPAAITCYLISKLARESDIRVLLSGQGADELFAGYPRYPAVNATAGLQNAPYALRAMAAGLARFIPGSLPSRVGVSMRRLRRVISEVDQDPIDQFLNYCMASPVSAIKSILSFDLLDEIDQIDPAGVCRNRIKSSKFGGLNRFLDRDLSVYLPNHNLLYTDKMGMAVGLEARVPLLDNELVDLAMRMPISSKIKGARTKVALRDAARGLILDDIIDRPKAGFGAPFRKWLKHDLNELWGDVMSPEAVARRGWFNHAGLEQAREASFSGRQDLYMLQWAALTTELWAREFIDR
jgi:asparagine synthase (glutamine-hydrolysing)